MTMTDTASVPTAVAPTEYAYAVDSYLLALEAANRSKQTLYIYRLALDLYLDWTAAKLGRPPDEILLSEALSLEHGRLYIRHLQTEPAHRQSGATAPRSSKTIRLYVSLVKIFAKWCHQEELLPANPLERLPNPREIQTTIHPFTEDQVQKLFKAASQGPVHLRDQALLLFMLATGVRVGELCGLTMANLDLKERKAKVLGKGNKERWVTFDATTARALTRYLPRRNPHNKSVFQGREGAALTVNQVEHIYIRLGSEAGILGEIRCSPHTMRHSFATMYLKAHPDRVAQLQRLLGHTTLAMTLRYAKVADIDTEDEGPSIVERLGLSRVAR